MRMIPVALLLVATACSGGAKQGGSSITIAGQPANDHGTEDVTAATQVGLELDEFYFSPTVLSGKAGQRLELRLGNAGEAAHTFTVDALGIDVTVEPGQETRVDVTLPDSGAFAFVCRFHAGRGMRGGLSAGDSLEGAGGGTAPGDVDDTGDDTGGGGYG